MKIILFSLWLLFSIVLWVFATSLAHKGQHDSTAFKAKSVAYWLAVIISLLIGTQLV